MVGVLRGGGGGVRLPAGFAGRLGYAGQYFAGCIVEKSLSIDNLFVFVIIMSSFAVPREPAVAWSAPPGGCFRSPTPTTRGGCSPGSAGSGQ
jgi:hypothetical protein